MPNKQPGKMLRVLKHNATEYAEKATRLSNLLDEAETFFQEMPGKMEVAVDQGNRRLKLERWNSDWRLLYSEDQRVDLVTEATVDVKAMAAQLLPELVDRLASTVSQRLIDVDAGLEALRRVPFLNDPQEAE